VKISLHQQLSRRERRVAQRIEKKNWSSQSPMIAPPSIVFQPSDRIQAVNAGGLVLVRRDSELGLWRDLEKRTQIFGRTLEGC